MALPGTRFSLTLMPRAEEEDPIAQIQKEVAAQPPPPPKAKAIQWNEALCRKLYEAVRDEKAYFDEVGKGKDKTKTKEYKYKTIAEQLSQQPGFGPFAPLSADTLKKKFNRELEKVSVKYSLEKEGSNLSGLSEREITDPCELMLYSMKCKELKYGREREAIKEKDKKRQADMLRHEEAVLAKDGGQGESDGEFEVEGFNKENEQSQMRKRKREAREKGVLTPKTPGSSEEEVFQKGMQDLLEGLKPSAEMLALQLREKELDIKAKEAAIENQKAMTQMMLAFLNR